MNIHFPLEEAVVKRKSVRNYSEREIDEETMKGIVAFIEKLENPFGNKVTYHYLDKENTKNEKILGTYGVIKGATRYVGTTIKLEPLALEALGYEVETLILYLAHLDIGTCWLGGTFNRKGFSQEMNISKDDEFPVIVPYGYAAEKPHVKEKMMRKMVTADQRKDWDKLFFVDSFATSLSEEAAGELAFALKMLRLAPSASNNQPWRVVVQGDSCHFFEDKKPGYSDRFSYDIQRIDMGIAAAHFDHAMKEKGMKGNFTTNAAPDIELPENVEYVFTWRKEG